MLKLCSIMTVVGFFGFWIFGFLALTSNIQDNLIIAYAFLAFGGLILGSFSYLRLCRYNPKK